MMKPSTCLCKAGYHTGETRVSTNTSRSNHHHHHHSILIEQVWRANRHKQRHKLPFSVGGLRSAMNTHFEKFELRELHLHLRAMPLHIMTHEHNSARKVLSTRASGVRGDGATGGDRDWVLKANITGIIFPWMRSYKIWWYLTVMGAILTAYFAPFMIAFQNEPGTFNNDAAAFEHFLTVLFAIDILVNFNLAFYDHEVIVFERSQIAKAYCKKMFWIDLIGVVPFNTIALAASGLIGSDSNKALLLELLRLLRFVRLHRLKKFSDILQCNAKISLMWFTLLRNAAVALFIAHFAACGMYFLARLHGFGEDTWIGPMVEGMTGFERYVVALYWSVVTFATVGYGDFSPSNSAEQIFGIVYMLVNIVVASWIIGSITLLIVKGDEKTGDYREALQLLDQYSAMHDFDEPFHKKLRTQLRLDFNNREIADEQILKHFPSAVRRQVLRRLYLPSLVKTSLMKGVRQQCVDAFLTSCNVEIFSPGEQIVERGSISSDLFLLVGGLAQTTNHEYSTPSTPSQSSDHLEMSTMHVDDDREKHFEEGDFIGEIGFFTESPQLESVCCLSVCKTLTMSRSAYRLLLEDHPGSVGKILQNLLTKVESMAMSASLPKPLAVLRAGSVFDTEANYGSIDPIAEEEETPAERLQREQEEQTESLHRKQEALTAIRDLVKMHMDKQKDDQTTRLLFAASRGDTQTVSLMCDQGFDPNNADYDNRTALMVAAMKGNTEVVKMILEYKANPNMADVHGSTALYEAVKNGHEETMSLLIKHGAKLCMKESLAASVLCQAVFDGDVLFLRRLLRAGIQVNAADYDKRTAAHIAAAEGNVAALRILVEHGADLTLEDRWANRVHHEAERASANKLIDYLKTLTPGGPSAK